MNGRTHLLLGLAAGVAIAALAPLDVGLRVGVIAAGGVGGLLPDIDHPRAIISGYLPGVGHSIRMIVSHRGPTHTLAFVALLCGLLVMASSPIWAVTAFAAGLISHIAADMLTPAGVPVLLPLSHRSLRLAPYPVLKGLGWVLEAGATIGAIGVIGWIAYKGI